MSDEMKLEYPQLKAIETLQYPKRSHIPNQQFILAELK